MTVNYFPQLRNTGSVNPLPLTQTHPEHIGGSSFQSKGSEIVELGKKIGAGGVIRPGSFENMLIGALDNVSELHQTASSLAEQAMINPDSVNAHDITIAQQKAQLSLDLTRNVLTRIVQGWRDLINTR